MDKTRKKKKSNSGDHNRLGSKALVSLKSYQFSVVFFMYVNQLMSQKEQKSTNYFTFFKKIWCGSFDFSSVKSTQANKFLSTFATFIKSYTLFDTFKVPRPQQIYKFADPLKPGSLAYRGLDLRRRSTSKKFPVYLDDYQV